MPKLKPNTIWPTSEEAAEIDKQASEDGTFMTDEQLANMRPAKEVAPEFVAAWEKAKREGTLEVRPRGRPKQDKTKQRVTLYLDEEIIGFFKAGVENGKGWQTRLNAALHEYIQSH